ncbi:MULTISPECIES: hypothetical protein [unclassified Haloferax]|uniref:hypothetical protein n=1 Tax=unclassified Haloferax TaxID=2625095 RepID=UPI000E2673F0|nr:MULTISPECIES: hypothetical protein [unclassified Haloferax]MDS0243900.1 hypothetical protein [Haloferax sp. S2CR25]MDS0447021.1 hypothetical protein [Haloferax sp. S2CR25-2]RDZ39598.1 hypothetical protein C5B87_19125 [Haloferax sp. Atlit-16N]RDZ53765.1 hypothetical protein C5B91_20360 [Haloferax sp. Atlit-10N]
MGAENEGNATSHTESDQQRYPFGLSSPQFAVLLVLVGLIGPGLLVYTLEEANLSTVADLVWIVGYGTTIFVVWFIWFRPLDLVGPSAQDTSLIEESEQFDTVPEGHDSESEPSVRTEPSAEDSTLATEDSAQEFTQESSEPSDSK